MTILSELQTYHNPNGRARFVAQWQLKTSFLTICIKNLISQSFPVSLEGRRSRASVGQWSAGTDFELAQCSESWGFCEGCYPSGITSVSCSLIWILQLVPLVHRSLNAVCAGAKDYIYLVGWFYFLPFLLLFLFVWGVCVFGFFFFYFNLSFPDLELHSLVPLITLNSEILVKSSSLVSYVVKVY